MTEIFYQLRDTFESYEQFHSLSAAKEWLKGMREEDFIHVTAEINTLDTHTGEECIMFVDGYVEILSYEG